MKKILFIMLMISVVGMYAQDFKLNKDFYVERELKVTPVIKQKLLLLRQDIVVKKLTFDVGYTTALDYSISDLAGLKETDNYIKKAKEQNRIGEELRKIDDLEFEKWKKLYPKKWKIINKKLYIKCGMNLKKWDWRTRGKVTNVRNQKSCGSCWAFATLGAFEANYSIRNGVELDLSEQNLVSCSGAGSCSGGWWAFNHVVSQGVPSEGNFPYTAKNDPCDQTAKGPYYQAVSWGYVDTNHTIPTVNQLKAALCTHGPLAVAVRVTSGFQAYTDGVFNENDNGSVNHGVTLIGWDDDKSAWLIKNSWGTGWGSTCDYGNDRGYMWISYNSNKIGYAAAWVLAKSTLYALPLEYHKLQDKKIIPIERFPIKKEPIKKEDD